jgi:uncharacterized protein (TIRG00374 family)
VSEPQNHTEQKSKPSWVRREWRLLVGLSLSALCLYLALREISLVALRDALAVAKWGWVLLALATILTSTFLKAIRWRALFLPQRIQLNKVWSVFMIGQMLNAVFPARAGEIGRIYLIGEDEEISRATALSTVVVEKVADLVMLSLAYLLVAVWLLVTPTGLPDWLQDAGKILIPLTFVALASLLLFAYWGQSIWRFVRKSLQPLPVDWQTKIDTATQKAIHALETLRHGEISLRVWGLSLLIWILMALTNGLLFPAFQLDLPPFVAVVLLVVLMSGVAVPPLPGNLGVFMYLCQLVLTLFGVDRETALVYGLTLQVIVYLPTIILGTICMVWENRSVKHSPAASRHIR